MSVVPSEENPRPPFIPRSPEEHAKWKSERPIRRRKHRLYPLKRRIVNLTFQPRRLKFQAHQVAIIVADQQFPRCIAIYAQADTHRECEKLRREARATHLAYAFLRAVPYHVCERAPHREDNHKLEVTFWQRVESIVTEFDPSDIRVIRQRIAEWREPPHAG